MVIHGEKNHILRHLNKEAVEFCTNFIIVLPSSCLVLPSSHLGVVCFRSIRSILGQNAHYGTPTNPADHTRMPGGSSSGSGVVVAANLVDFSLGEFIAV